MQIAALLFSVPSQVGSGVVDVTLSRASHVSFSSILNI